MQIENARTAARVPSLDIEGLALTAHATQVRDFHDPEEVQRVYLPEVARLILELTGASRSVVLPGGGLVRYAERSPLFGTGMNTQPARFPHVDWTERSAPGLAAEIGVVGQAGRRPLRPVHVREARGLGVHARPEQRRALGIAHQSAAGQDHGARGAGQLQDQPCHLRQVDPLDLLRIVEVAHLGRVGRQRQALDVQRGRPRRGPGVLDLHDPRVVDQVVPPVVLGVEPRPPGHLAEIVDPGADHVSRRHRAGKRGRVAHGDLPSGMKARVRSSMLRLGRASGGASGGSTDVCAVHCTRSASVSHSFSTSSSSGCIAGT